MRTRIRVTDLSIRQWDWLQGQLLVEYQFAPFEPRACVEFEIGTGVAVRHVEMPLPASVGLMMVLHSLGMAEELEKPLVRLPSAEQVRDLSAADAAKLAADMNREDR
jgi:hypothetical protein